MAVWSQPALSSIRSSFGRMDAEFYRPKSLEAFSRVTAANHEQLGHLVIDGYRVVYENTKIIGLDQITDTSARFLQATNLGKDGLSIELDSIGYVDERDWLRYPKGRIKAGELLIEVKGQAEKVAVVPNGFPDRTLVSGSLFKLTARADRISPWYLFVFLSSRYGKLLRDRLKTNTLIGFVSKPQLYSIPVFLPAPIDEQEISILAQESTQLSTLARELYREAQHLLESKLGLDKLSLQKSDGYAARFSTVNWSETFAAGRIDSQCFAPDALLYESWLHAHAKCDRLGSLLKNTVKGRQQADSVEASTDYCSIKHVSYREIFGVSKCFPQPDTPLAGPNDLLLAITGATIGKVGIVKRYERLAFSGDLLCLRANESIDPHYLLLALDHKIGQVQFIRWITGSTNGHLAPRDVARVLVPRLSSEVEAKIADLVKDSLAKRQESEQLLEKAKTRVEQLIEEAIQP